MEILAALISCRYEMRETMLKELNQVIDYVEEHITDDLALEIISKYKHNLRMIASALRILIR
jgi:hypothetical protein